MSNPTTPVRHVVSTHSDASAGGFPGLRPVAVVLAGMSGSALALAIAPTLMPDGYSWVAHTTSESAAQGVSGAWLARLGFLLFGLSVIWLASLRGRDWGRWAALLHTLFGVFMTAAAAFSTRSWVTGAGFDPTEDMLHSIAASAMGFAFALGVAACGIHLYGRGVGWRLLDVVAIVASVIVPLGMSAWPEFDGVLQRVMFAVAYLWYGAEAARCLRRRSHAALSGGAAAPA